MAITLNGATGAPVATTVTLTGTQTLTNKTLTSPAISNATFSGQQTGLEIAFNQSIVFEGTTADSSELTLTAGEPTDDRTVTLPNATTTLVGTNTTDTLTNKTINLGSNTVSGTLAQLNTAVTDADVASLAGSETLTNKTLTSPIISSISNSGTVTLPTATDTLVGRATTDTLTNKSVSLTTNTITGTLAEFNTALSGDDFVSLTGAETLTSKTLTSPTVNTATIAGGTLADAVIKGLEEDVNVVASAATGTINFDVTTASIWYYTSNATANFTLNFRYSSSVSLDTALAVGDAITLVFLNTNGATAYYPSAIQIDGNAVTPKVPAAISAGNTSAIDAYSFTIIKTASATFTVLETQTKFA